MRHPPQDGRALKAEGISPNEKLGGSTRRKRGKRAQAKWKIFSIHTQHTHRRSTWHLNFGQRSVHWISKCWWQLWSWLPAFLFSLACLCLLWVAFQTTRLPFSHSYFPKKEIKHFHSSCFCFAPIKVDHKKIIEMIQTCVCMCVSHPHKLSKNC